jgi:hypothetical protein
VRGIFNALPILKRLSTVLFPLISQKLLHVQFVCLLIKILRKNFGFILTWSNKFDFNCACFNAFSNEIVASIHVACTYAHWSILSQCLTFSPQSRIPHQPQYYRKNHVNMISLTASEIATYSTSLLDKLSPLCTLDL